MAASIKLPGRENEGPSKIPVGANNKQVESLNFKAGMVHPKVVYLELSDAKHSRFVVPDNLVSLPPLMSDVNFHEYKFPFGEVPFTFDFGISNLESSLVFLDKFI